MIRATDLHRSYPTTAGPVPALRGIDLTIPSGTLAAVFGPSGSGKTTLLNCLGALDRPDRGRITALDTEVSALGEAAATRWRRQHLGFVYQASGLLPWLTAVENVEVALRLRRRSRRQRRAEALAALDLVGLADRADHHPDELSGGQQQRTALARALAPRPPILLADEPTAALDRETGERILEVLADTARSGRIVVVATHDPAIRSVADRTVTITDGTIIDGLPTDASAIDGSPTDGEPEPDGDGGERSQR
ncbi:MAG: ABC transporter ATP-binding protein [Actinomycetota bacterium]